MVQREKNKTDLKAMFNSRYICNNSLQNVGKFTRSLRSLVRFPKFCNS